VGVDLPLNLERSVSKCYHNADIFKPVYEFVRQKWEDDDTLTPPEIAHLQAIRTQLRQPGDRDFEDWVEVKQKL
jgi:hypothetical protein